MNIRKCPDADLDIVKEITAICFDGVSIDQNIEAACGGRLRIIAALTDPASIRTCLEGVGLPAMPPPRAPPEPLFEFAA